MADKQSEGNADPFQPLLPWEKRTRQSEGRQSEVRLAKRLGFRLHPRSGAGKIKADGSDKENLYEVKDAAAHYGLKADDLYTLYTQALHVNKKPVLVVKFRHRNMIVRCEVERYDQGL